MEVPFRRQVWNLHLLRTRTSQHKLDSTTWWTRGLGQASLPTALEVAYHTRGRDSPVTGRSASCPPNPERGGQDGDLQPVPLRRARRAPPVLRLLGRLGPRSDGDGRLAHRR